MKFNKIVNYIIADKLKMVNQKVKELYSIIQKESIIKEILKMVKNMELVILQIVILIKQIVNLLMIF